MGVDINVKDFILEGRSDQPFTALRGSRLPPNGHTPPFTEPHQSNLLKMLEASSKGERPVDFYPYIIAHTDTLDVPEWTDMEGRSHRLFLPEKLDALVTNGRPKDLNTKPCVIRLPNGKLPNGTEKPPTHLRVLELRNPVNEEKYWFLEMLPKPPDASKVTIWDIEGIRSEFPPNPSLQGTKPLRPLTSMEVMKEKRKKRDTQNSFTVP